MQIAKVGLYVRRDGQLLVVGQLQTPIPSERLSKWTLASVDRCTVMAFLQHSEWTLSTSQSHQGFGLAAAESICIKLATGLPSCPVVVIAVTPTPGFSAATPTSVIFVTAVSVVTTTWRVVA